MTHGIRVGRKRVARLMRAAGLRGATLRRFVVTTTRIRAGAAASVDLVERRFYAERPNRLWVADITYIPTWSRLFVSGDRARCVLAHDRRLGDGDAPAHRADSGGAEHGDHAAPTPRGDPSLRPGLPGRAQLVVATRCLFTSYF